MLVGMFSSRQSAMCTSDQAGCISLFLCQVAQHPFLTPKSMLSLRKKHLKNYNLSFVLYSTMIHSKSLLLSRLVWEQLSLVFLFGSVPSLV